MSLEPTRSPCQDHSPLYRAAAGTRVLALALFALPILLSATAERSLATLAASDRPKSSERIIGLDPREQIKIRAARRLAGRRVVQSESCSALFAPLERTGAEAVGAMSFDLDADPAGCRRGVAAFTQLRGSVVSLCRDWLQRLDRYQLATLLIHEALHHAGLSEAPHDPEAPTSAEINRMVSERCGL